MPHLIAALTILRAHLARPDDESDRGSVTIEHVLWAVAVIAIVAIVVAAITSYVTSQAGKIT
ncbi:hypothetical protein ACFQ8T_04435 [Isoptericola sp. NPDC056618]|uniref:hypothetical protein n=1 Tax=Isoptericola sp. NPDC056618 TaxID=3345878 RepID=UPI0036804A4A